MLIRIAMPLHPEPRIAGLILVDNPGYEDGCSSSIAAAIPALHPGTDVDAEADYAQILARPGDVR